MPLTKEALIRDAALSYARRHRKLEYPPVERVDAGALWRPQLVERAGCCADLTATRANVEAHMKTINHIAAYYGITGQELRDAVRTLTAEDIRP